MTDSSRRRKKEPSPESGSSRDKHPEWRRRIPAGRFKAVCLALMDRVRESGEEYVITKRGVPVARLAPVSDEDLTPFVGRSRGVIEASREQLMAPLDPDWEPGEDL